MPATLSRRFALAVLLSSVALLPSPAMAADKLKVLASFSIIGDMAARVGGDRVEVTTLVGPNGDAHVYEPKPDDAKAATAADLLLVNGLGFEGWLNRLIEASGSKDKIVTLTEGIKSHAMEEEGDHGGDHDHEHGAIDPHAWQSVPNARIYVKNIVKALCAKDAAGCEAYTANGDSYDKELAALDDSIRKSIGGIPESRRLVITSHDAFGYFAREYGITFLAPEGISTESEASAKDVAALIRQIKSDKASALFVESISDPRLVEQISRETGLQPGGTLYSDALSDASGPASSYVKMMQHNASELTKAMLGS